MFLLSTSEQLTRVLTRGWPQLGERESDDFSGLEQARGGTEMPHRENHLLTTPVPGSSHRRRVLAPLVTLVGLQTGKAGALRRSQPKQEALRQCTLQASLGCVTRLPPKSSDMSRVGCHRDERPFGSAQGPEFRSQAPSSPVLCHLDRAKLHRVRVPWGCDPHTWKRCGLFAKHRGCLRVVEEDKVCPQALNK